MLLSFEQNIKVFEHAEAEPGEGKGKAKNVHWRRGHFKRQAYGPGWSKHRTIFVRPVMVNRNQFCGNEGDTRVVYRV